MKEATTTRGASQTEEIPWFLPPTLQGHPAVESRSQWSEPLQYRSEQGKEGDQRVQGQATGIPGLGEDLLTSGNLPPQGILQELSKLSFQALELPSSLCSLFALLLPFLPLSSSLP